MASTIRWATQGYRSLSAVHAANAQGAPACGAKVPASAAEVTVGEGATTCRKCRPRGLVTEVPLDGNQYLITTR